jgi:hypothetical protein
VAIISDHFIQGMINHGYKESTVNLYGRVLSNIIRRTGYKRLMQMDADQITDQIYKIKSSGAARNTALKAVKAFLYLIEKKKRYSRSITEQLEQE